MGRKFHSFLFFNKIHEGLSYSSESFQEKSSAKVYSGKIIESNFLPVNFPNK